LKLSNNNSLLSFEVMGRSKTSKSVQIKEEKVNHSDSVEFISEVKNNISVENAENDVLTQDIDTTIPSSASQVVTYLIEYAKSGRTECQRCELKIEHKEVPLTMPKKCQS
jgi:hypothetical protein